MSSKSLDKVDCQGIVKELSGLLHSQKCENVQLDMGHEGPLGKTGVFEANLTM